MRSRCAFDEDLWQRLEAHTIGPPDASLSFADRLARENRWSPDHARRVLTEYKRFCYLARIAAPGAQVTPSDAVDQAWHLHLTYSRDYWQVFCPEVLGADFHHGPTAGGQVERARYYDQYAATLKAYEDAFGHAPPADIWPDAKRRFEIDPKAVRVNPSDTVLLEPRVFALALFIAAVLAAILGWFLKGWL
ncbi:MAG: hypothetical protein AAF291_15575 [Pseudomonadota bacterium]